MTEHNDGFPDQYHILPNPFKAIGHYLVEFFRMHELSEVSDHFQHPLDTPVEPVTHIQGDETAS